MQDVAHARYGVMIGSISTMFRRGCLFLFPTKLLALLLICLLGTISLAAERDLVTQAIRDLETGNIASGRARLDAAIASTNISRDRRGVAYHARGELSRRAGELANAVADFSESIRLGGRMLTHLARASCYEMLDEPEKEVEDLNIVLAADRSNIDALNMRAEALYSIGKIELARTDLEKILMVDEKNTKALSTRAQIAISQKKIQRCIN